MNGWTCIFDAAPDLVWMGPWTQQVSEHTDWSSSSKQAELCFNNKAADTVEFFLSDITIIHS